MRFSQILVERDSLPSKIVRNFVGERTFEDFAALTTNSNGNSNIFLKLWNGINKFGGSLMKAAFSFISWSFSGLVDVLVEAAYEIAYFDWNSTDAEIKQEIDQANQQIVQQFGQLVGTGTVWIASIAVSAALTVKFPILAGRVALALAEEGGQELRGQLTGFLSTTTQNVIRSVLLGSFLWARKQIKGEQKENKKPWILATKIEEKVQAIKNKTLRNFTQGFLDGAFDSILEIGYVVAFTLDDYYAVAREANNATVEPVRTVQVFPDANSEESIIIEDTQENVEASINNYLGNHDLVSNRDIGTVVGQPYDDWYGLTPQGRRLILEYNAKAKPPFYDDKGKLTKRVQISIPDVKASLSWNDLKYTLLKFTWGNYLARGVFENRRQMTVWGATEAEAKSTLLTLAKLSTKSLIQVSVSHPEVQNIKRKKKPTLVYVSHATLLIRKPTVGATDYTLIDGQNQKMAKTRFELWRDEAPPNLPPLS
jgi:hypothetical protein